MRKPSSKKAYILVEVMVSLMLFALLTPPLLSLLQAAISETSTIVVLRKARLLAGSKMTEIERGIEKEKNGIFEDAKEKTIEGFTWSVEEEPVDFWPNPDYMPTDKSANDRNLMSPEDRDNLITLIKVTLTVRFPGDEDLVNPNRNSGVGIRITGLRNPTEDDIRNLSLDTR